MAESSEKTPAGVKDMVDINAPYPTLRPTEKTVFVKAAESAAVEAVTASTEAVSLEGWGWVGGGG
jgi:hypothetical protein